MSQLSEVKIQEETVVKPTYRVLTEDPIPYFESRHYPYTKLNIFDSKPTSVKYREIALENEFLRVSFMPSLGARIFSAFDKIDNVQIFNYIDTIRPTLIAIRGAWIAVGIEFNLCPFASHTVDNFSPVDYVVRRNEDGSASIFLGSLNLITRIEYAVNITLRPNSSRIETEIRTFNTDLVPQRYYFWSNAAVPASQGLKLFYPASRTTIGAFPINEQGVDLSWYKNHVRSVDLFMIDSEEDFFAVYNYDNNRGVVHVADHNLVPGKKFFTWGVSEDGLFWKDLLSDKGISYIEMQSGRFLTQGIVELLNPLTSDSWIEYWYPIKDLGGVTFANEKAALHIEKTGEKKIIVKVFPAIKSENARLEVFEAERKIYEETVSLHPGSLVVREIEAPSKKPLLKISSESNEEIISWDFRNYKTSPPEAPFWRDEEKGWKGESAEELWLKGMDAFKKEHLMVAKRYFEKSLEKDEKFSRSLTSLGLIYYLCGLYDEAEKNLRKALMRNPYEEEARYYLSLALMALGNYEDAEKNLWKIYTMGKMRFLAFYLLGIIAMRLKQYSRAEEMFRKSIKENGLNPRAFAMLSAALRMQGKIDEALKAAEESYELMPLDYLTLAEKYFLSSDTDFKRIVLTHYQKVLEVAKEYVFAGLYEDAVKILELALNHGIKNPMIYYYMGFALKKLGKIDEAIACYEKGEKESIERVFPHRLMDLEVLKDVVDSLDNCPTAHYLLGNVLFHKNRWEEALREWEKASEMGMNDAILYRNMGFAYSLFTGLEEKSIEAYKNAIKIAPQNYMLYVELDNVYSRLGLFKERVSLLEKAPPEAKRDVLIARLCSAYIDVERSEEALNILLKTFFEPMEGYYGFWETYVDALLAKGLKLLKENRVEEALRCFMDAAKYPRNLGVGAPYPKYRRDVLQLYYAGLAYELMGDKSSAEKIWNEALQRSPGTMSEHSVFQALILKKLGKEAEAKMMLEKIISRTESSIKRMIDKFGGAKNVLTRLISRTHLYFLPYDGFIAYLHYVNGLAKIAYGKTIEGSMEIEKSLEITKAMRHARWIKEGIMKI